MQRLFRTDRRTPLLAMVVLLVAACAAPPPQVPAGSPAPAATSAGVPSPAPATRSPAPVTPSPAPTPVDTEQALLAVLRDPGFSARVTIRGTETIPSGMWAVDGSGSPVPLASVPPTVLTYEGQAYVAGNDHLVRLHVADAPRVVIWEHRRDSTTWRRTWLHAWQEMPSTGDVAGPRLFDLLAGLTQLRPVGDGPDADGLLRFAVPDAELCLVTIWIQEQTALEPDTGTIEILARPDGTPVTVRVHLASDDLSYAQVLPAGIEIPPREYDFEYELSGVGDGITLPAAAPQTHAYKAGAARLALEVPVAWEELLTEPWDGRFGAAEIGGAGPSDGEFVLLRLMRFSAPDGNVDDATFQEFARWSVSDLVDGQGMELRTVEQTEVAGRSAYLLVLAAGADGPQAYLHQEALLSDGTWLYAIAYDTPVEPELQARYEFDQLLATVRIRR